MFYDKVKKLTGREQERFILKNLAVTYGMKIRKNRFDWTAYNKFSKYYFEFSDEMDIFYDSEGNDFYYPRWLYMYKEKYGVPVKEIVIGNIIEKSYKTYKFFRN